MSINMTRLRNYRNNRNSLEPYKLLENFKIETKEDKSDLIFELNCRSRFCKIQNITIQ